MCIRDSPYVLDIMRVSSEKSNQYDLPFFFLGHIMQADFEYNKLNEPEVLGKSDGYQHLYKEASASANGSNIKLNWLLNNKFYTYSAVTSKNDELIFGRIGANDPDFNLRNEQTLILRKKDVKDALFVSIIESHGTYSPVSELAVNAYSNIKNISVMHNSKEYTAIQIGTKKDKSKIFIISNENNDNGVEHKLTINNIEYTWEGAYVFTENK